MIFAKENNPKFRTKKPMFKQLTFLMRMIFLICALIMMIVIFLGVYFIKEYSSTVEEQIGIRALAVAQTVSEIPSIRDAFYSEDPISIIQPIVEEIRVKTNSEFIVVGNKEGIRYSHPLSERLGQQMVGNDNEPALMYGESYVSKAVGSLGPSVRGKVPIYSDDGEIIGIVSVGLLIDDIDFVILHYVKEVWFLVVTFIVIGIVGAILISFHVKKSILGLEPEEIGQLFQEREAIFQSIHEGIIAINRMGEVTMYNHAAKNILYLEDKDIAGKHVKEFLPNTTLPDVLETGRSQYNQEVWHGNARFVVNRVPIYYDNQVVGAVSTFRSTAEIERLAEELSKVKQYSEALRVQTHEFSNKLNTISGLLQLQKTSEAIEFIMKESRAQQGWIHFLIERVSNPFISAVLLGKLNRGHELGVTMSIDEDSQLTDPLSEKQREGLITILGNLLENAYDAVIENTGKSKKEIKIFFTDIGDEFIFEIEDSGKGIPNEHLESIFEEGFSTKKGKHRGIGLSLIQQIIKDLDGCLTLEESDLGGTCFIVSIPKLVEGGEKNGSTDG
ncbi:ATP-binding protein [Anaerobacillus sp. MEB173]|uniref:ATP-binding protein n=1 Tax=Anaerobacillus sp. MEB173 TaxID=3383345 RepID=UPI003F924C28